MCTHPHYLLPSCCTLYHLKAQSVAVGPEGELTVVAPRCAFSIVDFDRTVKTKQRFKIHLGIHVSVYLAGKQRRSRDLHSGAAQRPLKRSASACAQA